MKKWIDFLVLLGLASCFYFYLPKYGYTAPYLREIYIKGMQEIEQQGETIALLRWRVLPNDVNRNLWPAALDSQGNFYILKEKNLFKVIYGEDTVQFLIHNDEWDYPSSISCDKEGNIYVVDTGNHRILEYNSAGEFLFQIGKPYPFNYQSLYSEGIWRTGTSSDGISPCYYHFYVCQDMFGPLFSEYYDDTAFMMTSRREITTDTEYLINPQGIIVVNESIFISDFIEQARIQVFDKNTGSFVDSWLEKNLIGDTIPPSGSIAINSGATATNTSSVVLNLTAIDSESAIDKMVISNFADFSISETMPFTSTCTWTLSEGEGIKEVYVKFTDIAGNVSLVYSDTIILDTTIPITTSINIGEPKYLPYETSPFVVSSKTSLYLTVQDSGIVPSGISRVECLIDNDTFWFPIQKTGGDTLTGVETFTFTIPQTYTDGQHTAYFRAIDNAGNTEDSKSVTVILDNTPGYVKLIYPSKEDLGIAKVINSNTVSIIGTTKDIHFDNCKVQIKAVSSLDTPSDWFLLNESNTQKETGVLAIWNTLSFNAEQWYYIRLSSLDKLGNTSFDTVTIYFGNPEVKLAFGSHGKDNREFKSPYGIAYSRTQSGNDDSGTIFVTDVFNHRIQKFDLNGNFLLSFGSLGITDGKFICPAGIAVDNESGTVYVSDMVTNKIQVFDLEGNFIRYFAGLWDNNFRKHDWDKECDFLEDWCDLIQKTKDKFKKGREEKLRHPLGISIGYYYTSVDTYTTVCTKAIFVADKNNDRIAIFDIYGNFLNEIGDLNKPEGVFVDNNGYVYLSNTKDNTAALYSPQLTQILNISGLNAPKGICADKPMLSTESPWGYLYISDSRNNSIKKYNKYAQLLFDFAGKDTLALRNPSGICLDTNNNLYVVDSHNNRIIKISAPDIPEDKSGKRGVMLAPFQTKTLKDAYAYPVPFKPSQGHTVINFRLFSTLNVILRIYNIAGELVFEKTNLSTVYNWDVKNIWGEPIASGVYIYFLTDGTKEKKVGKIMIIK